MPAIRARLNTEPGAYLAKQPQAVILVEGVSDQRAIEALATRAIEILTPAASLRRTTARSGPESTALGSSLSRADMEPRGFYVCDAERDVCPPTAPPGSSFQRPRSSLTAVDLPWRHSPPMHCYDEKVRTAAARATAWSEPYARPEAWVT